MKSVRIKIGYYGRTRKYGPSSYKANGEAVALLVAEGWNVVHRASYVFVAPPSTSFKGNPVITVDIPEDGEIEQLAMELHGQHQKVAGAIGLWPYNYTPAYDFTSTGTKIDGMDFLRNLSLESKKPVGQQMAEGMIAGRIPYEIERTEHHMPSAFRVGRSLIWEVSLTWAAGDDQPPTWHRTLENVLVDQPV